MARKILNKIIDWATRIEITLSILMPRPLNLLRNSTVHFHNNFVQIPEHIYSGSRVRRCDGRNFIIFNLPSLIIEREIEAKSLPGIIDLLLLRNFIHERVK